MALKLDNYFCFEPINSGSQRGPCCVSETTTASLNSILKFHLFYTNLSSISQMYLNSLYAHDALYAFSYLFVDKCGNKRCCATAVLRTPRFAHFSFPHLHISPSPSLLPHISRFSLLYFSNPHLHISPPPSSAVFPFFSLLYFSFPHLHIFPEQKVLHSFIKIKSPTRKIYLICKCLTKLPDPSLKT